MPFQRAPGPVYQPGDPCDLTDPTVRYTCPECREHILRLPTGRMRYHGATLARGRRCTFPETEGALLATLPGLADASARWPGFRPVYLAVQRAMESRTPPKQHGGQLKHPDPSGVRWNRGRN